ncbi:hypothetical protein BOFL111202_17750 [Bordetella flabilis]
MTSSTPSGAPALPVLPWKCASVLKVLWPASTSLIVNWPVVTSLPSATSWSSVTALAPLVTTGTSLVPTMVTVTVCVALPSCDDTWNCSVRVSPAASACTAGSALFSLYTQLPF